MRPCLIRIFVLTIGLGLINLVTAPSCLASSDTLWHIGKRDNSAAEFAQEWFSHGPRRPVIYRVGISQPSRDWPAVQPSDYDPVGGYHDVPFTVLFRLNKEPRGTYVLRVHTFFNCLYYPDLEVEINGHKGVYFFEPKPIPVSSPYWKLSGNDLILATDNLEATIPASFLKRGENRLILVAKNGMHLQYDEVEFVRSQQRLPVVEVRLTPTIFYRSTTGTPEVVELSIRTRQILGPVTAELHLGSFTASQTANVDGQEFGDLRLDFDVPLSVETQSAHISVRVGSTHSEITVPFTPAKKWLVYGAASIHDDVGYRETQPRTQEWQDKMIDDAITIQKQYPWYKYNVEASWAASDYLSHRSSDTRREFLDLAERGEIGINALYADMETNALTPEEMARAFYLSGRYHAEYGIAIDSAAQGDLPSYPGGLPTFLASAGVKFFVGGSDQIRAPIYANAALAGQPPLNLRSPFFWEGPDGSRVLTWMAVAYGQIGRLVWGYPRHDGKFAELSRTPSENLVVLGKSLPLFLLNYTRPDYPYDAILLYGLYGDDHPLGDGEASIIANWNSRYAYPRIVLCTPGEFPITF